MICCFNPSYDRRAAKVIDGDASGAGAGPAKEAGAATLNYGVFINTVIDFLIIAFAIFMVIKAMNAAKRKEEEAPAEPTTKECGECLMEIPIDVVDRVHVHQVHVLETEPPEALLDHALVLGHRRACRQVAVRRAELRGDEDLVARDLGDHLAHRLLAARARVVR